MGNSLVRCCVGVPVVRVMRPNGRIDEFDIPIMASEVMQRYPQHLVIQSNYIGRDATFNQQRRKVSIVRPESKLVPGKDYILYPIPPQYKETVAKSFSQQLSCTLLNLEDEQQNFKLKRKLSHRSQIVMATRHHLATILQSARDSKLGNEGSEETVDGRARNSAMDMEDPEKGNIVDEDDHKDDDEEFSFYWSASWKPSLHSIPESPLRLVAAAHVRRHSSASIADTISEHG